MGWSVWSENPGQFAPIQGGQFAPNLGGQIERIFHYEQYLIDKFALQNLKNRVNPMGGRKNLYNQMIDGVIEKFKLPK